MAAAGLSVFWTLRRVRAERHMYQRTSKEARRLLLESAELLSKESGDLDEAYLGTAVALERIISSLAEVDRIELYHALRQPSAEGRRRFVDKVLERMVAA